MKTLFILFGFFTLTNVASATPATAYDLYQQEVNRKAYQHRFNNEQDTDEESGIQISPNASTEEFRANPTWKTVLMTGDDSINAFDNARKKIHSLFMGYGMEAGIQLSRKASEQVNGVRASSVANFEKAVKDLKVKEGDGCLVFITSHGSAQGFYIKGESPFTPNKMNQILNDNCGKRPTILLVSACYSGIFAEPSMQASNRIILTAARKDKTSFGCSAEATYTYWDACLVTSLPTSKTWMELSQQIEKCIETKESAGGFARSYPQARFGADVQNLEIKQ